MGGGNYTNMNVPVQNGVTAVTSIPIKMIAAGGFHSLVLFQTLKDVAVFGDNHQVCDIE